MVTYIKFYTVEGYKFWRFSFFLKSVVYNLYVNLHASKNQKSGPENVFHFFIIIFSIFLHYPSKHIHIFEKT